ncbi:indole-3-glycerol phosphate synthase TrpC [Subtercola boreus]|uniref:indole-3-glycerol-phosphate synthase n=1 Tax=Subtercola boreus TaxID=120213 RepID=A0A3E0WD55_9MICO|nr:indole-3-glycerol phosphate synthase TrpC [Subtercola boreus]RFA21285.1 indole-3-glycerol phosphate synthase [Subtercola boreus]RFA21668.1 indole-3-glycerol phosphate synthase [Subtercola boreus]RFA27638.1 indole-3-glycerol phosphate synthase [Subtercola boreus]
MLDTLTAGAAEDASARLALVGFDEVEKRALAMPPALDALAFLAPAERVKIIAEIKRASPSRGSLAAITDPAALASTYQSAGASAVSVLTEGRKFKGSLEDLELVRDTVSIPVLRKDFVSLDYQVFEARAAGADLVLLIVAALEQPVLQHLHELIHSLGMTALVETHSADEVERALDLGASLIGVNARNLSTFELDPDLFGTLADRIPAGIIRVAESAVKTAADVSHYRSSGADVVLVGEALVTGDPARTLEEFLGVS